MVAFSVNGKRVDLDVDPSLRDLGGSVACPQAMTKFLQVEGADDHQIGKWGDVFELSGTVILAPPASTALIQKQRNGDGT